MTPLVSVIVPVYNIERFLKKCIKSILSQTFNDFELLLIDDGSTDNSGCICDDYQNKDNRIKVIHKKNEGLSSARNTGLVASRGKYISFIDGDDFVSPVFLETLIDSIKKNNADIACCNFTYVNESGIEIKKLSEQERFSDRCLFKKDIRRIPFDKNRISYIVSVNKLYKKELFNDLSYPIGRIHEDEWLIHHILSRVKLLCCVSDVLYYYVQRENSIVHYSSGTRPLKSRIDAYYAFLDRYTFSKKNRWKISKHNSARGCMHIFLRIMVDYPVRDTIDFVKKEIKTIRKIDFFSIRQIRLRMIVVKEFLKYRRKEK